MGSWYGGWFLGILIGASAVLGSLAYNGVCYNPAHEEKPARVKSCCTCDWTHMRIDVGEEDEMFFGYIEYQPMRFTITKPTCVRLKWEKDVYFTLWGPLSCWEQNVTAEVERTDPHNLRLEELDND